jgi:hypothetical protein
LIAKVLDGLGIDMSQITNRYRIFVLGAGFSRAAGLPLAVELWREVQRRARTLSGRAEQFWDNLETYIQYRKACHGVTLTPDQVDFEEFLAFLDIEHYLGLRGSDTWSVDGNEAQVVVRTLIGEILAETTPSVEAVPELYRRFAVGLKPNDYVLTFNYDVLLERALESVGKPFRLFPQRFKNIRSGLAEIDSSHEEVVILKLHGSIDWFDRTQYHELEAAFAKQGSHSRPPHPVFANAASLDVVPLVDGPRFPNDPLRHMHRVRKIEDLYRHSLLFRCTPWLLSPSSIKILYAATLRDFWYGLGDAGTLNFGLAIVGFSLPQQDDYARQAVYRLVKNYQTTYWNEDVFGLKKRPLILIDRRHSEEEMEELRRRYAFLDWAKTRTYMAGFDENALKLLLGN